MVLCYPYLLFRPQLLDCQVKCAWVLSVHCICYFVFLIFYLLFNTKSFLFRQSQSNGPHSLNRVELPVRDLERLHEVRFRDPGNPESRHVGWVHFCNLLPRGDPEHTSHCKFILYFLNK